MKFLDEYRDAAGVRALAAELARVTTRPWRIMEVCGGQTHAIVRFGIDRLLPAGLELIHGPGCPVCVTPQVAIDRALAIAARPEVTFCSFGDMLRVPGTATDLLSVKAAGGDVRVVYSPLDAVEIARRERDREVVMFAVGFETTAPANAAAVATAHAEGLTNFSVLVSHVRVPPALEALLADDDCRVDGFLAAGHVCTIMGTAEYPAICAAHGVPIVVTGFEPLDLLHGIVMCVRQLEVGRGEVEIQYTRSVRAEGNAAARALIERVFAVTDRRWRGIGEIPASGLALRPPFDAHDAEARFGVGAIEAREDPDCISGLVLQGRAKPPECAAFGTRCTPEQPLGATMVSAEGACAAYYRYRRHEVGAP